MIQLPPIMEELDVLALSTNKMRERPLLIRLRRLCSCLNGQLLAWNERLENQYHGQLYWTVPSTAVSPADDPVLGRVFPLAFQFPCLRIAQLLLLYWSTLILLYRTLQDIQRRLKGQLNCDIETQRRFGLQDRDRSEVCSDDIYPSNDLIAFLANNISQSLEYCFCVKYGTLGPQTTILPLWIAQSFYESQPDRVRELAWCCKLGDMTAPDARFDLNVIQPSKGGEVGF